MEVDTKEYLDKKFAFLEKKQSKRINTVYTSIIVIVIALITSGALMSRADSKDIGVLEAQTEQIYKEYVPGDLLLTITRSFDLQYQYMAAKIDNDDEKMNAVINDFIEFRKEVFDRHFSTRSAITNN